MWWIVCGLAWAGTFGSKEPGRFYRALSSKEPVVRAAARAVVHFERGSGFVVSPEGHVLTNFHVARLEGEQTAAVMASGRWLGLELIASHPALDVALYRRTEPVPTSSWIELRSTPPRQGEPVAVIGNPAGLTLRVSYGVVVDPALSDLAMGDADLVGYSAATWWGSSGSPVIDLRGRAIAVHWGWDRWQQRPFSGVSTHDLLSAFPELADVVSGCPEPDEVFALRVRRVGWHMRARLVGPEACLARIESVEWIDAHGGSVAGEPRRRGRARWEGAPPVEARVSLEAGRRLSVQERAP